MARRYSKFTAVVILAMLFAACSRTPSSHRIARNEKDRKLAPDFTLTDANGKRVSLSDFRGKVVLLNFWATWCGPCAIEIPWFVQFEQQFRSKGLEIIGVSLDDDGWKAIKPFAEQHHINYPILLGNDSVAQLYGGLDALPTTFMIDREGRIAYPPHVGLADKNEYLHEIETLLGSGSANASRSSVRPGAAAIFTIAGIS
jgi:peroxiredoxin